MNATPVLSAYMTPPEVAAYLAVSVHALKAWRKHGTGPAYTKLGDAQNSRIRYSRDDVLAYAAAREVRR